MNTSLRKRPQVDFMSPNDLAEMGRDLAFMQRRIAELQRQDVELEKRFKELRATLRREAAYLQQEIEKVGESVIYQFKLTHVTYEEEVEASVNKLVEVSDIILDSDEARRVGGGNG